MDEKKFIQILEKNNQKLMQSFRDETAGVEQRMEKRFAEVEQKRIDDNFYFEHKYWDKISIIFDKLKLNDDIKKIEEEKNIKLQQKVENNSAKLMSLDFRVAQLEKNVNSK